jgi:hypothetical protein
VVHKVSFSERLRKTKIFLSGDIQWRRLKIALQKTNNFMQLPEFTEKHYDLYDDKGLIYSHNLFLSLFKTIPQKMSICGIDSSKIRLRFEAEMRDQILHRFYSKIYDADKGFLRYRNIIYILTNGYIFDLESDQISIFFTDDEEEKAEAFLLQFNIKEKKKKEENSISLIINNPLIGLTTQKLKYKPAVTKLEKNYNKDLLDKHPFIVKLLKEKRKSGLHLFHGIPGTGKSTYIKNLIARLSKDVLFISPSIASSLDSPNFLRLLLDQPNSILVIEDAEQLIVSREGSRNSNVAMLLNLTDGILGDGLGIQVIATFNTPLGNIDKALLRKGRLLSIYEFKALELTKARSLMQELGKDPNCLLQATTLADIYHYDENDSLTQTPKKNTIGFLSNVN